jgi:protein OS-9
VLPAASIPSYLAAKESQAVSEDERLAQQIEEEINDAINLLETGELPLHREDREVAGNVEIGAHKFIPADKKLEKGVIVGGGKEKHLATIAKSGGWVATEKVLQKVGIKSAKDVDTIKKEVERAADGKNWRLDVVETPRGKELRGVIEAAREDGDSEGKGGRESDGGKGHGDEKQEQQQEEGSEETYKEEL